MNWAKEKLVGWFLIVWGLNHLFGVVTAVQYFLANPSLEIPLVMGTLFSLVMGALLLLIGRKVLK